MALGAILGAALTDHSAHPKGLFVGGLDVIKQPGSTAGNLYGVPIESVRLIEDGPGGVSGLEFVIQDPLLAVSLTFGVDVRFHDFTRDVPLFLGWIQGWTIDFDGGVGRNYTVRAIGVEAQLDWAVLPADFVYQVGATTILDSAALVQAIFTASTGTTGIRALSSNTTNSTQAGPITKDGIFLPTGPNTIAAGTTLREAINTALGIVMSPDGGPYNVTIDFTYGLRVYANSSGGAQPSDYTTILASDTSVVSNAGEPTYEVTASEMPAGVIFKGTGVTAVVPGGLISVGPWVVISDTSITTLADATAAAVAYINGYSVGLRGTWTQSDVTPYTAAHAGGCIQITDTQMGLTGVAMRLSRIEKTFNASSRENWVMSFGGEPPSGSAMVRRLTRATLS